MNFRKNQSFWTSVILHVAVLLGLFLATVIELFKPEEPEHVFVMVEPPSSAMDQPTTPPQETPPEFTMPDLPALPDVPDLPEPAPVVTPPTPTPVVETPAPAPKKPAPVTPPKTLSYEDFIKQQGAPKPRVRTEEPRAPTPTIPKFDPGDMQKKLEDALKNQVQPERNLSQQDMSELLRYNEMLSARLNRAWGKPSGLSGIRLQAVVVFDVSASGQLMNIRLNPGSGNNAFDQSVIAAFKKVANAGPTPTRRQHTFTKTFRMVD
jgi:TonB family protein